MGPEIVTDLMKSVKEMQDSEAISDSWLRATDIWLNNLESVLMYA